MKKPTKKRVLRYLVVIETDTDFKEELIHKMMTIVMPVSFKGAYPGKSNKITVNKLDL